MTRPTPSPWTPRLFLAALGLLAAGCTGTRTIQDPTVQIHGELGSELGVSTVYGVVFLGHAARAGRCEVTAWFGDGPSIEAAVVEPIGGGLYTAETEIRLPASRMSFRTPQPGEKVWVRGRRGQDVWQEEVRVTADPRVDGVLLPLIGELTGRPDQIGAGVFESSDEIDRQLIGLVSGRLRLTTAEGTREYLTVVGPTELWRLVAHRRDHLLHDPWVYREDIL